MTSEIQFLIDILREGGAPVIAAISLYGFWQKSKRVEELHEKRHEESKEHAAQMLETIRSIDRAIPLISGRGQ